MNANKSEAERIQEIIGWLDAYRNQWVSYDRSHVLELQAELRELRKRAA